MKFHNLIPFAINTNSLYFFGKSSSVIFANHYMISKGQGLIVIPERRVPEFKRLLVAC